MKVEHGKGVTSLLQSHMMDNIRTMGSEVHSHNSSCIYSIENQMGTLLSFPCQLRLGFKLPQLKSYTKTHMEQWIGCKFCTEVIFE